MIIWTICVTQVLVHFWPRISLMCAWKYFINMCSITFSSPKGAKVYPASRRRSNKRVGLKGQLAPHCVP